jgi:regulator of protease activity HflC (stomatin/prohibitin superfamily)
MLGVVKVVGEQECGVLFRRGRLVDPSRGPGRVWTIPRIDRLVIVDVRPTAIDIPPVEAVTKDGQALLVSAHVQAQVVAPAEAVVCVVNYIEATSQLAETAVRAVFREHLRDEVLFERRKIVEILQKTIDDATSTWGVRVLAIEVAVGDVAAEHAIA